MIRDDDLVSLNKFIHTNQATIFTDYSKLFVHLSQHAFGWILARLQKPRDQAIHARRPECIAGQQDPAFVLYHRGNNRRGVVPVHEVAIVSRTSCTGLPTQVCGLQGC